MASGEHRFLTEQGWRHVSGGWCRFGPAPAAAPGQPPAGPGPRRAAQGHGEHTAPYRQGYLCGLVRGDGGASAFPSEQVELEALGRAHHFLAEAAQHVVDLPVARPVHVRVGEGSRAGSPRPSGEPIAPISDVVSWPDAPDDAWCAGFLGGIVDACGGAVRGELWITAHRRRRSSGGSRGRCTGWVSGSRSSPARAGRRPCGCAAGSGSTCGCCRSPTRPSAATARSMRRSWRVAPSWRSSRSARSGAEMTMYDITTGTGDFVAEGVVSHNCFARNTHTYLDLDAGADFDSQIVVKVNAARVLAARARRAARGSASTSRWAPTPIPTSAPRAATG